MMIGKNHTTFLADTTINERPNSAELAHIAKETAARKAELAQLRAEWAQSRADAKGKLQASINTVKAKLDELSSDRLRFHVDHCAYADMYRSRGQADAGIAFSCKRDAPFARALVPGVTVEQSKTILEGNHRCEFTYTLEDR